LHADGVALIVPPGWTLITGGPQIGIALLAGALRPKGIPVSMVDWNIELAGLFGASISEDQARAACAHPVLESLNQPYFQAQQALDAPLSGSSASWDLQLGYSDRQFDHRSASAVFAALQERSALDGPLQTLAAELLNEGHPRVIGLSVTVPGQILPALYAARALRATGFEGRIVLGGNLVTRLGQAMALPWLFDWVDALAIWQGELSLPLLWEKADRRDWQDIPNLIWHDGHELRVNHSRQLEPAEFTLPDFQGLPLDRYWGSRFLTSIGSRGCYYGKCSFCSIPYSWGKGGFLGNDSVGNILQQLTNGVSQFHVNRYKFIEEALHPSLLSAVSTSLQQSDFAVEFEGYARFDRPWMEAGNVRSFARAGLKKVYLGMELARTRTRNILNKSDTADFEDMLSALHDEGIKSHVFCMFGYPGTGVDDAVETIDFALRHEHLIDSLDIFPFYYATHTSVLGIRAVPHQDTEWSVEQSYEPLGEDVLSMNEVAVLVEELEGYLWKVKPAWLHPVYRMVSPWAAV